MEIFLFLKKNYFAIFDTTDGFLLLYYSYLSLSFAAPCLLFVCPIIQWLLKVDITSLSHYPSKYLQYPWVIGIYSSGLDHYFMTIILQNTSFILISFSPRLNNAYQNVHWIQIYQNKIKQAKKEKEKPWEHIRVTLPSSYILQFPFGAPCFIMSLPSLKLGSHCTVRIFLTPLHQPKASNSVIFQAINSTLILTLEL